VDAGEHHRRCRHAAGALRSLELLDVLFELPAREPVSLATLSSSSVRVVRSAPPGIVTFTDTAVVRQAIPVITPILAIVRTAPGGVTAARLRDGLEHASRFAAYCPRLLLTPRSPKTATDELLAEASWAGIGVASGPLDAATVLVEPEPVAAWQPTPAWWYFTETVYQHFRTSRSNTGTDHRPRRGTSTAVKEIG
jgi:hypothetical protein